jgi:hypothetical protein
MFNGYVMASAHCSLGFGRYIINGGDGSEVVRQTLHIA